MNGKKVLVTGGAGFIGSNLVDKLAEKNEVIVVDDFSSGKKENLVQREGKENVKVVEASILDKGTMKELAKGNDVIFHLAVQCLRVSLSNPDLVHEVNATGSLNVLEAAKEAGVEKFVYVSSSEVYGTAKAVPMKESHVLEPTTVYGASKLAGELYTRAFFLTHELPAVIVRPFNTYGPREHFEGAYGEVIPRFVLRALNDLPPLIFGTGEQTRDFTFVEDTVEGIILAAESKQLLGEEVNIARGEEVSINRVAELVLKELGKENLKAEHGKERPADVQRHYADISIAKNVLGFEPKVGIEEGIKKFCEWFKEEYKNPQELMKQMQEYNW